MFRNINNKMSILHIRGFYTVGTVVPDVEAGDDSLLLFGNHWLGLLKSLQQILKAANKMETKLNIILKQTMLAVQYIIIGLPGEHLVEVLDLLAVPDGLNDDEERLVSLLLG